LAVTLNRGIGSNSLKAVVKVSIGVDQMQRNFEGMKRTVVAWQENQLTDDRARLIIYRAFVEGDLEAPRHLDRVVHAQYFNPGPVIPALVERTRRAEDDLSVERVRSRRVPGVAHAGTPSRHPARGIELSSQLPSLLAHKGFYSTGSLPGCLGSRSLPVR
jgi:hypothetical protein